MRRLAMTLTIALSLLQPVPIRAQDYDGNHLYAVLINGGRNRLTNHERYWNDCAFLYRTLRQTFHIPKRYITVLMSDGGAPEEDMLRADARGFASSSPDLDGDGQPDIDYPATADAVSNVLIRLSRQMTSEDHLFLFVVDHGGSKDYEHESFIWLWNDDQLQDYALGTLLSLFHIGSANVLMGQCYAGGFMDNLTGDHRIVTTACSGSEQSWTSPDRPYDEFVYYWICAVNGADEAGNPINADTNADGLVSMAEAFEYARSHDRVNETPQFLSQPEDLGDWWTFKTVNNGIIELTQGLSDHYEPVEAWSLSGVRSRDHSAHGVYILRQGGKARKVIK